MVTLLMMTAFALAQEPTPAAEKPKADTAAASNQNDPVTPKPLGDPVNKGLAWLAKTQNEDGGWGQGGGWRINRAQNQSGRVEGADVADPSDLGNTAIALQAFLRAGVNLDSGEYAKVAGKAAEFLLKKVEAADQDSLYVTDVRDTQLQSKIGVYVDTFLATQILSDLKGKLPKAEDEIRRSRMLDKVIAKIEKHQKDDGAFANNRGWASTLSQGLCSRSLNAAWGAGAKIQVATLEKDHAQNAEGLDRKNGVVAAAPAAAGDAGVAMYRYASKLGGMNEFARSNTGRRDELKKVMESTTAPAEEKAKAKADLGKIDQAEADRSVLLKQVAGQVKDEKFVAGFGNNGGEEFISYMNIGEALRAKGGKDWQEWDKSMSDTIAKAQNEDGSWAGHHCITGRTFCTATALLVLMTDRAPVAGPVAAK